MTNQRSCPPLTHTTLTLHSENNMSNQIIASHRIEVYQGLKFQCAHSCSYLELTPLQDVAQESQQRQPCP